MKEENYINDHFEQHLRESIGGHRSHFDGENMWNAIDGQIPGPQQKRRLGWIWITSLLLIGFAGGYLIFEYPDSPSSAYLSRTSETFSTKHNINNQYSHFTSTSQNQQINSTPQEVHHIQEASSSQIEVNPNIGRLSSSQGTQLPESSTSIKSSEEAQVYSTFSNTPQLTNPIHSIEDFKEKTNQKTISEINQYFLPVLKQEKVNPPQRIDRIMASIEVDEEREEINSWSQITPYKKSWDVTLAAVGGYYQTENNWTASNEESQTWVDVRKKTEKMLETLEGGLRIGLISPINLGIETGLVYHRQNELFKTTQYKGSVNKDPLIMTPDQLPVDSILRTVSYVTETTTRRVRNYNSRSSLRIPLNLTYRQAIQGWILGGALGVTFDIPMNQNGKSLSYETFDVENWGDSENWNYRNSPSMGYHARLEIGKVIAPGLTVTLEPSFHGSNNSIIEGQSDVSQFQQHLGVNLAITKTL